jgi:predicted DNA-binding transcriptional regulator YafY
MGNHIAGYLNDRQPEAPQSGRIRDVLVRRPFQNHVSPLRYRGTLAQLSGAVDGRKQVTITYAAGNTDKPSERKVDPCGLIYSAGDWQLVGLCHLRNAQRTFRVDRIVIQRPEAIVEPKDAP